MPTGRRGVDVAAGGVGRPRAGTSAPTAPMSGAAEGGTMSERNSLVRSLHDLGLAAWFGGSLAGAVGINGAAADVPDKAMRLPVAHAGWARWSPVNLAAIGAHLVGVVGLLVANRDRVRNQKGVGASTI